jgi:pimeloyl-ACP methyl ester carboxylesterase
MSTSPSTRQNETIMRKVYRAFFHPGKYEPKSADQAILARGTSFRIPFESGELAVTTWGEGPAVLLMHGWGGARAQMTGLVEPLLKAGYRVVAYDQPAHGESDGTLTNLLEIASTMRVMVQQEKGFYAVIAHSFGTLITSYALVEAKILLPERLVYFGSFNRLMDSLSRFQAQAGLTDEVIEDLRRRIYENFGRDLLESITNDTLAPRIALPALMFHDVADNVTPIEDSRTIAQVWKHARLIETQGLGHRGALQSREIHRQVVRFLKGE